jgi:hypothetical protein
MSFFSEMDHSYKKKPTYKQRPVFLDHVCFMLPACFLQQIVFWLPSKQFELNLLLLINLNFVGGIDDTLEEFLLGMLFKWDY